jgi:RNA polymerase sigma-70 factor (ECF subfamily)
MAQLVTEKALAEAASSGDAAALEKLLLTNYSALEHHIGPHVPADANRHFGLDDIVQEVFCQAFRDIGQFQYRDDASFLAWLKTIADHRLADALKHKGRKKRGGGHHQLSSADVAKASTVATLLDIVCQDSHLPDDSAVRREAENALQIALAGLPDDQREAIRDRFLQGIEVEEIADRMGRSPAAIRGLIKRAKENLAVAMGRSSRWLSSR